MKTTIVVDNFVPISSPIPFLGEHGFSLLIEAGSTKILLDTGQSSAIIHNLSLLGVHPNELDAIVLSHGHYDHAGGLAHILNHRNKPIPVYAHNDIFKNRYSLSGGNRRSIGVPNAKEDLTTLGAQWNLSAKPLEIIPDLVFSGQVPRLTDYETGDARLVVSNDEGCYCQDAINDDTSLYFSSKDGLVVIGGCAHSGFVNTVENGFKISGKNQLIGWIGGTHLGPASPNQQVRTFAQIEHYNPRFISASHCTGFVMMAELQRQLGDKFIPGYVGQVIQLD